jgi:predicted RNase H-like HicB family nuclease
MIFHVTLDRSDENWIVIECPALPGCISQGRTEEEAIANIREAITGWMWAEDQKALKKMPVDQMQTVVAV